MDLTKSVEELMTAAVREATNAQAEALEPAHLFIAATKIDDTLLGRALRISGIDPDDMRERTRAFIVVSSNPHAGEPARISGRVWRILEYAVERVQTLGRELTSRDVIIALLRKPDRQLQKIFARESINADGLIVYLENHGRDFAEPMLPPDAEPHAHPASPVLDQFGRDYTSLAKDGKLDPVIGRHNEIKQVVRILLQKQKNNPVLVGEAGVGKTSIVEGLALRIAAAGASAEVRNWRIIEISTSSLVAGTKYRGEFEERLEAIIKEAAADEHLILFIDEVHTLVGGGAAEGALDAANILKPALARGGLRLIGATTTSEYRQYIEKDAALERRFQPVRVEEPTADETREILARLREIYESHHQVEITEEAIDAAVDLSIKYLPDRRLPDKARDLIDRAAVTKRFLTFSPDKRDDYEKRVTRDDVAKVIAQWTGIPVERLTADARQSLRYLEEALMHRVVGQDQAVDAVARAVRTAMLGLAEPKRPYGVFLFMGPTGVGKTEFAKALAESLFGDEKHLIRFDMSEYMESHSVSRLVGSPPGYVGHDEGGALTNAVRRNPYSVLLFDEIEKAHPRVADIFLQVFDDGRLTDSQGRTADFRHTIIILTTNVKSERQRKDIPGFRRGDEPQQPLDPNSTEHARQLLIEHFRPELVNRLSRVVQFYSLEPDDLRQIIDKIIERLQQRISDQDIKLRLTPGAYDLIMKIGNKPEWGARALERIIEERVVQPLAQRLLNGVVQSGDVVFVGSKGDELSLTTNHPGTAKGARD